MIDMKNEYMDTPGMADQGAFRSDLAMLAMLACWSGPT